MIVIRNTQRKVPINKSWVKKVMQVMLHKLRYADFDVSVVIVNDATMRRYNRDYRSIDRPTDILSFPFHDHAQPGKRIKASGDEKVLGDLIICAPYIVRAAHELGISFDERLLVLLVHGVYHLCGYDHITDADYNIMHRAEMRMIRHIRAQFCCQKSMS